MKKLLIIAATLSVVGSNAQTSQKGCVNIFNSGNTPLQGVQVMAYGASPTDTDNQGKFLLTFPSMSVGNAISIPQIYKTGYELVNNASTEWILSDKREMKFVMAPEGTLDEAKAKYYKIGSENYSAKYSLAVAELNRRYHASEIDADTRKMELDSLNVELSAYMSKLDEYSSKLARINPDDLDAIEKRALDLLNKGDIDAALMVYDDARLVEMANTKSQGADIAEEDANTLAEAMYRYADICDLAGGKENESKATAAITKIAELFPNNFNYQFNYLLRKQSINLDISEDDIQKVLKLANNDKSLTTVLSTMALHYMRKGNFDQTMDLCSKILERLAKTDISMQSGDVLGAYYSTCSTMASCFYKIGMEKDAIKEYLELEKILLRDMDGETNEALLSIQTDMLSNVYYTLAEKLIASNPQEAEKYIKLFDNLVNTSKYFSHEEKLFKRFNLLSFKANSFLAQGNIKVWAEWMNKANIPLKQLYEMKPGHYASLYINSLVSQLLAIIQERSEPNIKEKIDDFAKFVESYSSELPEQYLVTFRYYIEEMHTINYRMMGNEEKATPHILKMKEYSEWLYKNDSYNKIDVAINGLSTYLELIIKDLSRKDEALQLAYALDALCSCADLQGKTYSQSARSNIATILMQNEKYDVAVESFEIIKKEREAELKRNPNNQELRANLSSTYNNLSSGYYYMGKYDKAYDIVTKAVGILEPFYNSSTRTTYATNYFIMLLNSSTYAYLAKKNDDAIEMLNRIDAVAKEMKNTPGFEVLPYITQLYMGDFLIKNGDVSGKKLVEQILKYRKGQLANDWLLLYIIDTYNQKGGVYVK